MKEVSVSPPFLLFMLLLTLKLCGVIEWSWWWVAAPLWIPLGVVLFVLGVLFFVAFCVGVAKYLRD